MADLHQTGTVIFGGDQVLGNKTVFNTQPDLTATVQQIRSLLEELSKEYGSDFGTDTPQASTAIAQRLSSDITLRDRIMKACQSFGFSAVEEAIRHPLAKPFVAAAKSLAGLD
ncbi:MAG: hypothetical protein AAF821_16965 [Cyanobacteria bacterium P01_D01_bin.156]